MEGIQSIQTLQGSLSKITNERDQLIERKNDLQCKLAEWAEKMVKLEYKMKKNLTSGTPEVTSASEQNIWSIPPKRKTQPQIQAKPKYEKRLEDEYAALGSELARTTDAQIKAAQERVNATEEQLQQAQKRIATLEEQAQQKPEEEVNETGETRSD